MKSLLLATLPLLCLSLPSFPSAVAGDAVGDSCAAIRDFVDVRFCASALRSDPKSASSGRLGHLLIAVDLALANATAARAAAGALSEAEPDAGARAGLEACGIVYGMVAPALRLLRGYAAARGWEAAESLLFLAGQPAIGCAAALGARAARLGRENDDFGQLAAMVTALLNSVKQ